ncbi:MAG TPA: DUF302 domain-containing protein [Actinomycetospora sp.]|uniref:DUF302 domain-containing protein n=1 Tax=Actinomycetospora sp. TaxID=1872135 RepID=UPI002F42D6C8
MDAERYTTKSSPWSVPETVDRLTGLIAAQGMTLFATTDQRPAARGAGLELLVWDDGGRTRVSYVTPAALAARHDLPPELAAPLAGIDGLTDAALTAPSHD